MPPNSILWKMNASVQFLTLMREQETIGTVLSTRGLFIPIFFFPVQTWKTNSPPLRIFNLTIFNYYLEHTVFCQVTL